MPLPKLQLPKQHSLYSLEHVGRLCDALHRGPAELVRDAIIQYSADVVPTDVPLTEPPADGDTLVLSNDDIADLALDKITRTLKCSERLAALIALGALYANNFPAEEDSQLPNAPSKDGQATAAREPNPFRKYTPPAPGPLTDLPEDE